MELTPTMKSALPSWSAVGLHSQKPGESSMNLESHPLVSIVTPVYNGARYLSECIETVLSQTYPHWEYIIVDNCSTDGSAEIARQYAAKYPRIRVFENPQFLRALPNHNAALR